MNLLLAIPGVPVSDLSVSAASYRVKLGFALVVKKEGFAKLQRGVDGFRPPLIARR